MVNSGGTVGVVGVTISRDVDAVCWCWFVLIGKSGGNVVGIARVIDLELVVSL